ncbi:MAG: transporter, partial [Steroidobacteraceae bacterium]
MLLCTLGIAASAVAGTTSETSVAPQETMDEAWWTGPLLAPNAATLPHGHWLVEPYLYDVMP